MSSHRVAVRHLTGVMVLASSPAFAAMGNIATTYGILPSDVASAQALSLFTPDVSAVYYNPAALTKDPRGELTLGGLIADHEITAESRGGSAPLNRQGDTLPIDESEQMLLGMKTNVSSMTKANHPLYFGIMLGVERYGREMMDFQSGTSTQGQSFHYSRQPLFIAVGGGTNLWRGIDAGLSVRITLHSDATMTAQSDLAGNTQYEELQVSAKPTMTPILGLNVDWGRTVCPNSDCGLTNWATALTWRAATNAQTRVKANVVIPGTVPEPGLDLGLSTLDAYQPETMGLGLQYQGKRIRIGISADWQRWSALENEFASDTIRDQANLRFKDTLVPRVGGEFRLNDSFALTAGVAYEPSPLKSDRSLDVNYLDNDRYIVGLGASAEFKDPWIFAFPVRLDFGYQLHLLQDRRFELSSSQVNNGEPYETLETGGRVNVFVGSLTLKF